jgi:hypothetical protein
MISDVSRGSSRRAERLGEGEHEHQHEQPAMGGEKSREFQHKAKADGSAA